MTLQRGVDVKGMVILFDGDGVLIERRRFARYLELEHGLTSEITRSFYTSAYERCVVGQADLKEVLPPFLSEWGWQHSLEEFIERWFEEDSVTDHRLVACIRALRGSGIRCCLATNQERYRSEYLASNMGFGDIFDGLYFSATIGYRKPDLRFYASVTQAIGLPRESILFWDDEQANVDAAREYGWRAETYVGFHEFASRLVEHAPGVRDSLQRCASQSGITLPDLRR